MRKEGACSVKEMPETRVITLLQGRCTLAASTLDRIDPYQCALLAWAWGQRGDDTWFRFVAVATLKQREVFEPGEELCCCAPEGA